MPTTTIFPIPEHDFASLAFVLRMRTGRGPHVSTSSPPLGVGDDDWTAAWMTTQIGCFTSGEALTNGQQAATKWVDEAVQLFKPRAPPSTTNRLPRVQGNSAACAWNGFLHCSFNNVPDALAHKMLSCVCIRPVKPRRTPAQSNADRLHLIVAVVYRLFVDADCDRGWGSRSAPLASWTQQCRS